MHGIAVTAVATDRGLVPVASLATRWRVDLDARRIDVMIIVALICLSVGAQNDAQPKRRGD
jgi:hypothetical protein